VFAADELFIRAGRPLPPRSYYGDYPQIENGVGLVRMMLEQWRYERRRLRRFDGTAGGGGRRLLLLSSVSARPFVERVARGIEETIGGVSLAVRAVDNRLFGSSVTVAGLLAGADLIRTARARGEPWDELVLPAACLNHRGYTLDSFSVERIGRSLGKPVRVAADVAELVRIASGKEGGDGGANV
jgi:NifB/MoaA-like Fe-S oxidoreductase